MLLQQAKLVYKVLLADNFTIFYLVNATLFYFRVALSHKGIIHAAGYGKGIAFNHWFGNADLMYVGPG